MKIRTDYVTNSSSSSFVIGKKDDTSATIESVFQIIKDLYREMLKVRDAAIEYAAAHPELKIQYVQKDGYGTFECVEKNREKRWKLQDVFEERCGVSVWEYFHNYDWIECETYADYEKYWLDKMANSNNWEVHAPFTIADFLEEREINWLHFRFDPKYDTHTHKVNSTSDVIGWYVPYIEEAYKYPKTCDGCRRAEDREYCLNDCLATKTMIRRRNIPEDKACLYLLGRVCIHSESGYIPSYVVDRLYKISEYSCNHMG